MANSTLYFNCTSSNTTELVVTNSSSETIENNENLIEDLSLVIQSSMASIGFIGNSLTFITLRRNRHIFASSVLKLIQSQAILDAIVCFLGSIYVLQPPMWKTHWNEYLDIFICHVSIRFILPIVHFPFWFLKKNWGRNFLFYVATDFSCFGHWLNWKPILIAVLEAMSKSMSGPVQ